MSTSNRQVATCGTPEQGGMNAHANTLAYDAAAAHKIRHDALRMSAEMCILCALQQQYHGCTIVGVRFGRVSSRSTRYRHRPNQSVTHDDIDVALRGPLPANTRAYVRTSAKLPPFCCGEPLVRCGVLGAQGGEEGAPGFEPTRGYGQVRM